MHADKVAGCKAVQQIGQNLVFELAASLNTGGLAWGIMHGVTGPVLSNNQVQGNICIRNAES